MDAIEMFLYTIIFTVLLTPLWILLATMIGIRSAIIRRREADYWLRKYNEESRRRMVTPKFMGRGEERRA